MKKLTLSLLLCAGLTSGAFFQSLNASEPLPSEILEKVSPVVHSMVLVEWCELPTENPLRTWEHKPMTSLGIVLNKEGLIAIPYAGSAEPHLTEPTTATVHIITKDENILKTQITGHQRGKRSGIIYLQLPAEVIPKTCPIESHLSGQPLTQGQEPVEYIEVFLTDKDTYFYDRATFSDGVYHTPVSLDRRTPFHLVFTQTGEFIGFRAAPPHQTYTLAPYLFTSREGIKENLISTGLCKDSAPKDMHPPHFYETLFVSALQFQQLIEQDDILLSTQVIEVNTKTPPASSYAPNWIFSGGSRRYFSTSAPQRDLIKERDIDWEQCYPEFINMLNERRIIHITAFDQSDETSPMLSWQGTPSYGVTVHSEGIVSCWNIDLPISILDSLEFEGSYIGESSSNQFKLQLLGTGKDGMCYFKIISNDNIPQPTLFKEAAKLQHVFALRRLTGDYSRKDIEGVFGLGYSTRSPIQTRNPFGYSPTVPLWSENGDIVGMSLESEVIIPGEADFQLRDFQRRVQPTDAPTPPSSYYRHYAGSIPYRLSGSALGKIIDRDLRLLKNRSPSEFKKRPAPADPKVRRSEIISGTFGTADKWAQSLNPRFPGPTKRSFHTQPSQPHPNQSKMQTGLKWARRLLRK